MDTPLRTLSSVLNIRVGCLLNSATRDNTALIQRLWVITTTVLATQQERMAATACARLFQDGNALISSTRCFEEKLTWKSLSLDPSAGRLQTQQKVLIDEDFSQRILIIWADTCIILHRGTTTSCCLLITINSRKTVYCFPQRPDLMVNSKLLKLLAKSLHGVAQSQTQLLE